MFVYNLEYGVNFCGEKFCWRFLSLEPFFLRIVKKPAKIRTGKNLVPHGRRRQALTTLCKIEQGWEGRVFQRLLLLIKAFFTRVHARDTVRILRYSPPPPLAGLLLSSARKWPLHRQIICAKTQLVWRKTGWSVRIPYLKVQVAENFRERNERFFPNFGAVTGFPKVLADLTLQFKRYICPLRKQVELI